MGHRHYKPRDLLTDAFKEQLINSVDELIRVAKLFYDKNWALGTSGNFSVLLSRRPFRLLVTASGKDKGQLQKSDFVIVDETGTPVDVVGEKPSAETLLHVALAKHASAYSILHTHSVWSTILSDRFANEGKVTISGYEMLKGLSGIKTHESSASLRIFENTQDIEKLATALGEALAANDESLKHGFLIRKHGMYTWGRDLAEAKRHVEILEFLLEVTGRS